MRYLKIEPLVLQAIPSSHKKQAALSHLDFWTATLLYIIILPLEAPDVWVLHSNS